MKKLCLHFSGNSPILQYGFPFQLYSMDICPNYSATILGFGKAVGSLAGFFDSLLMNHFIEGTVSKSITSSSNIMSIKSAIAVCYI